MPERTHLPIQDEALSQIRTAPPSDRGLRVRAGLRWIANYLDGDQPDAPMTGDVAKRGARLYALAAHSDDHTANGVMWDLRRALPAVRAGEDRAEYATRVRLHLQEVTV